MQVSSFSVKTALVQCAGPDSSLDVVDSNLVTNTTLIKALASIMTQVCNHQPLHCTVCMRCTLAPLLPQVLERVDVPACYLPLCLIAWP